MLVNELQQALDAILSALEAEDDGLEPEAAQLHLQQAHLLLTYSRAALTAELDDQAACLVDEVLCGLIETVGRLLDSKIRSSPDQEARRTDRAGCAPPLQQQQPESQRQQQSKLQQQRVPDPTDTSNVSHQILQLGRQIGTCEQDGEAGSSAAAVAAAESVSILHQCQRAVSGTLSEISGLKDVKQELTESVLWPLRVPGLFKGYRKPPRSFLFAGPPGTGKTMLIEKLAAESGMMMLAVTPSTCLSKWSGESEKIIRAVFAAASSMQPSIVFIDEVDALAGQRSSGDDAASRRLLTELLLQMTAVASQDVFIFACTNRIQDCDAALLRRFERRIFIPLPDPAARHAFFTQVLQRSEMSHSLSSQDIDAIVETTHGYSCCDLQSVCRSAAMAAVRELFAQQHSSFRSCSTAHGAPSGKAAAANTSFPPVEARTWLDTGPTDEQLLGLTPRLLCLQDFTAALEVIKPTAVDQASLAMP